MKISPDPYATPVYVRANRRLWPRSLYVIAHFAMLVALVVILWPVLGSIGGYRIDGQHPVPDGTLLSSVHAAGVGYWWLIWVFTFSTDLVILFLLRWRGNRPVRNAWLVFSTLGIFLNSLVVYALYFFVFQHDLHPT